MPHLLVSWSNGRGVTRVKSLDGPGAPQAVAFAAGTLAEKQPVTPNQAMLDALARIDAIQTAMQPVEDRGSAGYLQEARSGGMYGHGSDE